MENFKTINFSEILNNSESGDILLFQGYSIPSYIVRFFDNSLFSHIGIIYKHPKTQEKFLWHSTYYTNRNGNLPKDVISKKVKHGPQLNRLKTFLPRYKGIIFYRKHIGNLFVDKEYKLYKWMKKQIPKTYEMNPFELLKSSLDCLIMCKNTRNTSSFFCSELIVETFKEMEWLDEIDYFDSNEYTPKDFSTFPHHETVIYQGNNDFEEESIIHFSI